MTRLRALFRGAFTFLFSGAFVPYLLLLYGIIRNVEATNEIERTLSLGLIASGGLFLALGRLLDELRGLRHDLEALRTDLGPAFALLRKIHLVRGHYNEDGEFIADNGEN